MRTLTKEKGYLENTILQKYEDQYYKCKKYEVFDPERRSQERSPIFNVWALRNEEARNLEIKGNVIIYITCQFFS